jgi:hypothetical protein
VQVQPQVAPPTTPHPHPCRPYPPSCAVTCPVLSALAAVLDWCRSAWLPLERRPLPSQVEEVVQVIEDTLKSPTPFGTVEDLMAEVGALPGAAMLPRPTGVMWAGLEPLFISLTAGPCFVPAPSHWSRQGVRVLQVALVPCPGAKTVSCLVTDAAGPPRPSECMPHCSPTCPTTPTTRAADLASCHRPPPPLRL